MRAAALALLLVAALRSRPGTGARPRGRGHGRVRRRRAPPSRRQAPGGRLEARRVDEPDPAGAADVRVAPAPDRHTPQSSSTRCRSTGWRRASTSSRISTSARTRPSPTARRPTPSSCRTGRRRPTARPPRRWAPWRLGDRPAGQAIGQGEVRAGNRRLSRARHAGDIPPAPLLAVRSTARRTSHEHRERRAGGANSPSRSAQATMRCTAGFIQVARVVIHVQADVPRHTSGSISCACAAT